MVNQPGPKLKTEFLLPSGNWFTSFFLNTGNSFPQMVLLTAAGGDPAVFLFFYIITDFDDRGILLSSFYLFWCLIPVFYSAQLRFEFIKNRYQTPDEKGDKPSSCHLSLVAEDHEYRSFRNKYQMPFPYRRRVRSEHRPGTSWTRSPTALSMPHWIPLPAAARSDHLPAG